MALKSFVPIGWHFPSASIQPTIATDKKDNVFPKYYGNGYTIEQYLYGKFEDNKGVIIKCKLKKDRQNNGQKKKDKRSTNITQKTKYHAIRSPL